jgi:hypothetical protein
MYRRHRNQRRGDTTIILHWNIQTWICWTLSTTNDDALHRTQRQARVMNMNEASRVERLVEQNSMKAAFVKEIVSEKRAAG